MSNFEMDLGTERVEVRRVQATSGLTYLDDGFGYNLNTIDEVMSDDVGYVVMQVLPIHRDLDNRPELKSKVKYALIRVMTDGSFDILTLRAKRDVLDILTMGINSEETEVLRAFPESFDVVDRYVGDVYEYIEVAKENVDHLDPYESFVGDLLVVQLYMLVLDRVAGRV